VNADRQAFPTVSCLIRSSIVRRGFHVRPHLASYLRDDPTSNHGG